MICTSKVGWSVGQKKNFDYFYVAYADEKTNLFTLDTLVTEVIDTLIPIGPTILVEWEK